MKITLWGTRGSLASPGADMARYGGNTACVAVEGNDGTLLVLDAGTGIRRLGVSLSSPVRRLDLLLTHLHMDHVQGLGFFSTLYDAAAEVHIWGPASTTFSLKTRLVRYLSPPLFPVRLNDLPCTLHLHDVPCGDFEIGEFKISAVLVCHPGPTVAYRIAGPNAVVGYFPDHEPALGVPHFPLSPEWTSGFAAAAGVDLLIHDSQYSAEEYPSHVGWGHSSIDHAIAFAALAGAKHLVPFHHDPAHSDGEIDRIMAAATVKLRPSFAVTPGTEGTMFELP